MEVQLWVGNGGTATGVLEYWSRRSVRYMRTSKRTPGTGGLHAHARFCMGVGPQYMKWVSSFCVMLMFWVMHGCLDLVILQKRSTPGRLGCRGRSVACKAWWWPRALQGTVRATGALQHWVRSRQGLDRCSGKGAYVGGNSSTSSSCTRAVFRTKPLGSMVTAGERSTAVNMWFSCTAGRAAGTSEQLKVTCRLRVCALHRMQQ